MRKLISLFILFTLFLSGCRTSTEPVPPEKKPPGYQEDVPWPSLADSPWPMEHRDPQNTGRSKLAGPIFGKKIWEVADSIWGFYSGITIGNDSTIYFIGGDSDGVNLYAYYLNGKIKFRVLLWDTFFKNFTAPLIRNDGSIVCYNGLSTIYSFTKNGSLQWKYIFPSLVDSWNKTISIDKKGNLYITTANKLTVLSANGILNWEIVDERIGDLALNYAISFSPDGKTAYLPGKGVSIIAIDVENQKIKWTFGKSVSGNSPMIDSDGNIYFELPIDTLINKSKFISLNSDGALRWEYENPFTTGGNTSPTIDKSGNIYFGTDTLFSVNFQGELRWKVELEGICDAPIICDNIETIFVTTTSTDPSFTKLYSINNEGVINWTFAEDGAFGTNGSSAIGFSNTIIIPIIRAKLLTIN